MQVKLEQFLAMDSVMKTTVEALASAINSTDKLQTANAIRAHDKMKEVLSSNFVRRRNYTSLCRTSVQKNRLLDSYIVRHLLIGACVNALTTDIGTEPADELVAELSAAIENRRTGYSEIARIAETIAKAGKYQSVLDILLNIGNKYSLNQSEYITYFLTGECYKANKAEHARLIEDVIDRLDTMKIEPKSPDHIYRQVLLIGCDGKSKSDIDAVVLSNRGVWYIIEAKTGKKKNRSRMRQRARSRLKHQYWFLNEKLGMSPKLIGVYRINGSREFDWFRYKKPA